MTNLLLLKETEEPKNDIKLLYVDTLTIKQ